MKKFTSYLLLTVTVLISQLNAIGVCTLRHAADFLIFDESKYICNKTFDESDLLDFNELTFVENEIGDVKVYKDKSGNIWFLKSANDFREYVGGHILKLILGDDRIAEIKLVKGHPYLNIASKKLEGFKTLHTLGLSEGTYNVVGGFKLLSNNEDLLVGMNYIGLEDRHIGNQGYIEKNGKLEAARVDYDFSFNASGSYFGNRWLFGEYIDYGKLEKAITDLLKLPDDQIHQILEKGGIYFSLPKQYKNCSLSTIQPKNRVIDYLKERKDNFKQLLPLIICLKKVLNEGDINYLEENKSLLMSFKNTIEPELGSGRWTYLDILVRQSVERGCVKALKKLKELGLDKPIREHSDLIRVAYEAKQDKVLRYLLDEDNIPLTDYAGLDLKVLEALKNRDYEAAKHLLRKSFVFLKWDDVSSRILLERVLNEAICSNDLTLVEMVITGLRVDVKKEPVLELALEGKSSLEIFRYLLRKGAGTCLSIKPDLIHEVARKQRSDVFELFLQYGADPDFQDEYGKTAHSYFRVRVLD